MRSFKARLSTSVAMVAVALTSAQAQAQTAPAAGTAVDEIVVTGTRVVRDGYEAPTPLTVLGAEALEAAAPENIADLVNDLPSVVGSASPQTSNLSFSNGQAGLNTLNLRGLGSSRTLVLLDGQRSVPSTINGLVDVNDFPQQLISRVDIVTGGASAAYGSDALSGVVNFVLNKDFTGVKGEVSGGLTTYGDDPAAKVALSAGTSFANGRGHLLASGEWSRRWGIFGVPREWNNEGWAIINNPAYGTNAAAGQSTSVPQRLLLSGVGLGTAMPGGIITNTALRGTYFGPGGTPAQFNYGPIVSDPFTQGGDWKASQVNFYNTLDQRVTREGIFLRSSYDVSENVTAFAQAQWGFARSIGLALKQFNIANLIVRADNAFIPAAVAQRAQALGLSQFTLGSNNVDMPTITFDNERTVNRYVVGFNGSFDAMDTAWTWDAYYQKGVSRTSENGLNVSSKAEFGAAIDAVRTANGTIACRVNTDANPANDMPGCVPYNVMGLGVNSQAAINYIFASPEHPQRNQRFAQDVYAFTLNGEPFDIWAGPVSLALGAEHRKEAVRGRADPISLINGWFAGNYLPTFGSYNVTEGFAETVVPLAKDEAWADSLDLNAAVRATSYSTSGMVVTWKVGATYQPMSDIRFRVTRSRDIRAPNLNDLYQAGTANTNNVTDPFNNNALTLYQGLAVGNPALEPEKADTTGIGAVVSPSFIPGLTASVDYYNINVKGGINSIGAQTIVDRCFQGVTQYCAAITRGVNSSGANVITQIRVQPFNFAEATSRGLDLEASYTMPMDTFSSDWGGNLNFRFLATRYLKNYANDGINPAYDTVGVLNAGNNGPPKWVYTSTITYAADPITLSLTGRGMSGGVYGSGNYAYIQCTTGCPVSTTSAPTININRIASAFYLDLGTKYKFLQSDDGVSAEMFLNVNNLLNKNPPVVASGPGGFPYAAIPAAPALHDVLGRMFRAGIRFQM
ncbi:MAG: TonB-dependent receptor [Rhodospirillaceae bacterium]|nr:TonB-dependent receptor [Rhodospirillaceae bacterium]